MNIFPSQKTVYINSLVLVISTLLITIMTACAFQAEPLRPVERINHVIIIFQENWSFDGLYGKFPGANGLENAEETIKQVDKAGVPYTVLPQPINNMLANAPLDDRFPATLPVQPFDAGVYVPPDQQIGDPTHRFYQNQYQINGGKMDKFVAWGDTGALPMSFYDARTLPIGQLAQQYTLADNFFQGAFGGSMLNHFWLICACTPQWPNAPAEAIAQLDGKGMLIKDGSVTPDGYLVNNALSINRPRPSNAANSALVPNLTNPTIGDRLSDKQISWAWYTGGWRNALKVPDSSDVYTLFTPFAYFKPYADGTNAKEVHLKDLEDFIGDIQNKSLPAVSFLKPLENEHPGLSIVSGQRYVEGLVKAVQNSPYWSDTAIIITYDENGGRWDHVPPPIVDRWGPGTRVPTIIISPYAKKGYVDHTLYDTTSILKFIETRWQIAPLGTRDAAANDMLNAFDFTLSP